MTASVQPLTEPRAWDPPPQDGTHVRDMSRPGYVALCGVKLLGLRLPVGYSSCAECERIANSGFYRLFA